MIPYGRQHITPADIRAVEDVLRSDWLTQGPAVPRFEDAVAHLCGTRHAVAVCNATSALHLACLALGVGQGDLVWTSAITFVASANCARYCGADVDFVDIDPRTHNMSVLALERKLAAAAANGKLPKVVIPVHMSGQACDLRVIRALADRYGFRIIEDASHAIGGRYRSERIGNCRYGDITVFSFHPVKLITTAEGGMALTNDAGLAAKMSLLRSHGVTRDCTQMTRVADGPWYYEQIELGFNYRMTDMQAALGLSQLQRLDEYLARRHVLASRYDELLQTLPVTTPWVDPDCYSALHLYIVRIQNERTKLSHREVFERLRAAGIGVNLHYIPLYRQPYYAQLGYAREDFPEAERYYSEALTLPLYPTLSDEQQLSVVAALTEVMSSQAAA